MDIRLDDVDFDRCQIRVNEGKGRKDRVVPFPPPFKETLALHADGLLHRGASYLFESSWKKPYSDRPHNLVAHAYSAELAYGHPVDDASASADLARRLAARTCSAVPRSGSVLQGPVTGVLATQPQRWCDGQGDMS